MALAVQNIEPTTRLRNTNDAERSRLDAELRELVQNAAQVGDLETSIEQVLGQLDQMPHLNAHFRHQAAQDLVYGARANLRNQLERQSSWTIPERAAKLSEARLNARLSLYDWPLPGCDVRLGDATVADLQTATQYHEERAAGEAKRAGIYRQIAKMLEKSRKNHVRDGVPEARLAEVMRGAQ